MLTIQPCKKLYRLKFYKTVIGENSLYGIRNMIAKLRGRLGSVLNDCVVIDVNGVGYLVYCGERTLSQLPIIGEVVSLEVETVVREDQFHLYGFVSTSDREWFRLLRTVQSVGAKMALSILSMFSSEEVALAIISGDRETLTRVSGVGSKLAERLITELKDKVPANINTATVSKYTADNGGPATMDAVSALVNLGYRQSEAYNTVLRVTTRLGKKVPLEKIIQAGLKELSG